MTHLNSTNAGSTANIATLALQGHSAEWASRFYGNYEYWEQSRSETHGRESSTGTQTSIKQRLSVLPSEFLTMPKAGRENGIPGYFGVPGIGFWKGPIDWRFVSSQLPFVSRRVAGYEKRDAKDFDAAPWTDKDRHRLGLTGGDDGGGGLRTMDW